MSKVTIYSSAYCPYCMMAKRLLDRKGISYEEVSVDGRPGVRAEMRRKAGGRNTVPQIWIGNRHIGGCDDLHALDEAGGLDPLLASPT
ncbi:MAG: glutaredoxin 3 [Hyphomicrobiaceae bacterium]|nr:glutaredoxin 3 [Hyphomicrobiaceae bacterium]